jgi:hypothetical protein
MKIDWDGIWEIVDDIFIRLVFFSLFVLLMVFLILLLRKML